MFSSLPKQYAFRHIKNLAWARKPLALSLIFTLLSPLALAVLPQTAHAQSQQEAEEEEAAMEQQRQEEARKNSLSKAPPSALPGVENSYEEPSIHSNNDTNPTQALFESINKGSMNAAREALSRGADITARNVLDQTPLDMAIDLNRNNIVFLLLSLRGYNPEGHLIKTTTHEETGDMSAKVSGTASMVVNPKREEPHYDPSGGVPIPKIGFLGYGPTVATPKKVKRPSTFTPALPPVDEKLEKPKIEKEIVEAERAPRDPAAPTVGATPQQPGQFVVKARSKKQKHAVISIPANAKNVHIRPMQNPDETQETEPLPPAPTAPNEP
ncbi:ankyrin repeat domain-containing protein [Acetobacteraceae bacterium]|nr:ankyrin repeat domain-containing protein [Acetobacteraceae bacterium]